MRTKQEPGGGRPLPGVTPSGRPVTAGPSLRPSSAAKAWPRTPLRQGTSVVRPAPSPVAVASEAEALIAGWTRDLERRSVAHRLGPAAASNVSHRQLEPALPGDGWRANAVIELGFQTRRPTTATRSRPQSAKQQVPKLTDACQLATAAALAHDDELKLLQNPTAAPVTRMNVEPLRMKVPPWEAPPEDEDALVDGHGEPSSAAAVEAAAAYESPDGDTKTVDTTVAPAAASNRWSPPQGFASGPILVDGAGPAAVVESICGGALLDEWGPRPSSAAARRVAATRRFAQKNWQRHPPAPTVQQQAATDVSSPKPLQSTGIDDGNDGGYHGLKFRSASSSILLTRADILGVGRNEAGAAIRRMMQTPPPSAAGRTAMILPLFEGDARLEEGSSTRDVLATALLHWYASEDSRARTTVNHHNHQHPRHHSRSPPAGSNDEGLQVCGKGRSPRFRQRDGTVAATAPTEAEAPGPGAAQRHDTAHRSRLDPAYAKVIMLDAREVRLPVAVETGEVAAGEPRQTVVEPKQLSAVIAAGIARSEGLHGRRADVTKTSAPFDVYPASDNNDSGEWTLIEPTAAPPQLDPSITRNVSAVVALVDTLTPSRSVIASPTKSFTSPSAHGPHLPPQQNLRHAVVVAMARYPKEARAGGDLQPEIDGLNAAAALASAGFEVTYITTAPKTHEQQHGTTMKCSHSTATTTESYPTYPTKKNILAAISHAWRFSQRALHRHRQLLRTPGAHLLHGALDPNPQAHCVVVVFGSGFMGSLLGHSNRFWLVPPDVPSSKANAPASLISLDELAMAATADGCPALAPLLPDSPTCPTANTVLCDAMLINRLQGAPTDPTGFCVVSGRRCIGSALQAVFTKQRHLGAFYIVKALQGHATRDSRLSVNSINSYLHDKMKPFGVKVETSASALLIGDSVLARADQMESTRADLPRLKQSRLATSAVMTITVVPVANQDPRTNAFTREVVAALRTVASSQGGARDMSIRCVGNVLTGRLALIARFSAEVVAWASDETYRKIHEMRVGAQVLARFPTAARYHLETINGRSVAGMLDFGNKMATSEACCVIQGEEGSPSFRPPGEVGVALDAAPVTAFGLEIQMRFATNVYTAVKVDRLLRCGKATYLDGRCCVTAVHIAAIDAGTRPQHHAATLIQSRFRGWLLRKRCGAALSLLRREAVTRQAMWHEMDESLVEMQRAAFTAARQALEDFAFCIRRDLYDLEDEEWRDVTRLARNSLTRREGICRARLERQLDLEWEIVVEGEMRKRMVTLESPWLRFARFCTAGSRVMIREIDLRHRIVGEEEMTFARIRAAARNWLFDR